MRVSCTPLLVLPMRKPFIYIYTTGPAFKNKRVSFVIKFISMTGFRMGLSSWTHHTLPGLRVHQRLTEQRLCSDQSEPLLGCDVGGMWQPRFKQSGGGVTVKLVPPSGNSDSSSSFNTEQPADCLCLTFHHVLHVRVCVRVSTWVITIIISRDICDLKHVMCSYFTVIFQNMPWCCP